MPSIRPRILVVDDDPSFRNVLDMRLQQWGYGVRVADDAREAEDLVREWHPHLVLSDVVMPETSGLELLGRLRQGDDTLPVILLTAHGTVEMAVESMKLGAVDFLTKPLNYPALRSLLNEALERRLRTGSASGGDRAGSGSPPPPPAVDGKATGTEDGLGRFLGRSRTMRDVFDLIGWVAASDASVLITGESGTGKELAASTIHELSRRQEGPFIPLNTAAIPRELMESEIFGHEKGAFTGAVGARAGCFELADHGTLFLDEIGEMPRELQPKLLRVLDEAKIRRLGGAREHLFDVRTVAATNRDPRAAVAEGVLREDLYFRLNVLHVHLPPLREREGDVPFLARRFVAQAAVRHGASAGDLHDDTLEYLVQYPWPGNVRELRNLMERAVVLARGATITPQHLPPYVRDPRPLTFDGYAFPPEATVADAERELILRRLEEAGNNKTQAARRLGVSARTIHNKLKSYGIEA
jgi:DNA-binding NtrC family response regulator